eukprot:127654_1
MVPRALFWMICMAFAVISAQQQQPNIIFLMCDSMDGRNMDPTSFQYNLMHMPNLRSIADQGVSFVRHYTNSPKCVPGRVAMFTGRRIDQIKTFGNKMGLAMDSKQNFLDPACVDFYGVEVCEKWGKLQGLNYTLFDAMTDIGYDVYLYGKLDIGGYITERIKEKTLEDGFSYATGFHKGPPHGGLADSTRSANIVRPQGSQTPVNITNDNRTEPTMEIDYTTAAVCIDKLKHFREHTTNISKPWLLHCSINIPHPPFYTNEIWLNEVDRKDIPIPVWINESLMHPSDYYATVAKSVYGDFSDDEIEMVRSTYYAMNSETDYILGTIIKGAFENGYNLTNTIFVFISDHGEMNMEHRQIYKSSMFEGSSRIPMFWAGPNIRSNVLVTNLTQSIDFLPTLIELGGGVVPEWFSGYSVKPFLLQNGGKIMENEKRPDYITSQYHGTPANTGVFMVRKGEWKYLQYGHYLNAFQNYSAQLFNLSADGGEIKNVILQYPSVANEMENILSDLIEYEMIDCIAKQNNFEIFEQFFWNKYNQSELYSKLQHQYHGFDENDWNKILDWREQLISAKPCQ